MRTKTPLRLVNIHATSTTTGSDAIQGPVGPLVTFVPPVLRGPRLRRSQVLHRALALEREPFCSGGGVRSPLRTAWSAMPETDCNGNTPRTASAASRRLDDYSWLSTLTSALSLNRVGDVPPASFPPSVSDLQC